MQTLGPCDVSSVTGMHTVSTSSVTGLMIWAISNVLNLEIAHAARRPVSTFTTPDLLLLVKPDRICVGAVEAVMYTYQDRAGPLWFRRNLSRQLPTLAPDTFIRLARFLLVEF